jgi:inner membrane protein involved in colicin E2 resistance
LAIFGRLDDAFICHRTWRARIAPSNARQISARGYSANWQVLELNRAIPQNYRAVRYGILLVAITLLSQDYALLFGALLLFTILAALMLATRRLDWANIRREDPER